MPPQHDITNRIDEVLAHFVSALSPYPANAFKRLEWYRRIRCRARIDWLRICWFCANCPNCLCLDGELSELFALGTANAHSCAWVGANWLATCRCDDYLFTVCIRRCGLRFGLDVRSWYRHERGGGCCSGLHIVTTRDRHRFRDASEMGKMAVSVCEEERVEMWEMWRQAHIHAQDRVHVDLHGVCQGAVARSASGVCVGYSYVGRGADSDRLLTVALCLEERVSAALSLL